VDYIISNNGIVAYPKKIKAVTSTHESEAAFLGIILEGSLIFFPKWQICYEH